MGEIVVQDLSKNCVIRCIVKDESLVGTSVVYMVIAPWDKVALIVTTGHKFSIALLQRTELCKLDKNLVGRCSYAM